MEQSSDNFRSLLHELLQAWSSEAELSDHEARVSTRATTDIKRVASTDLFALGVDASRRRVEEALAARRARCLRHIEAAVRGTNK